MNFSCLPSSSSYYSSVHYLVKGQHEERAAALGLLHHGNELVVHRAEGRVPRVARRADAIEALAVPIKKQKKKRQRQQPSNIGISICSRRRRPHVTPARPDIPGRA